MKTGIVVLSWGHAEMTREFFRSLEQNTFGEYEVAWVQNEYMRERAAFDCVEMGLRCDPVIIQNCTNVGFPRGVNQGVRLVLGENSGLTHLALVNNDVLFPPDWLNRLGQSMPSGCAAVGPLVDYGGFQRADIAGYIPMHRNEEWCDYDQRCPAPDAKWFQSKPEIAFFCVLIPVEAWDAVGELDERFTPGYGEDTDWCYRARQLGWSVGVSPCLCVHHEVGVTSGLHGQARFRVTQEGLRRFSEKHGV